MNSFDEIMQYCPFLKKAIEDKIAAEAKTRDLKIQELEAEIEKLKNTEL